MTPIVPFTPPTKPFCGIAFVGEAPGDVEVARGKPMVGPSGRILTQACQIAGIDRETCWVGNVFDEQLPDNDVESWCSGLAESRTWGGHPLPPSWLPLPPISRGHFLRPEYHYHLARLEKELKALKPTVIIPLGGTALWAFNGVSNISKHRGAVAEASMTCMGAKLIPTFHPAAILHMYKYFTVMVFDLLKAKEEAKTKEITYTLRELWLEPGLDDIRAFKRSVLDAEYLSIDIETLPAFRQITCVGFADSIERALTIPFTDKRQPDNSYWRSVEEEVEAWKLVAELCGLAMPKIGQNFTYDIQWLLAKAGIRVKNYLHDTRLMHHALYSELPKDLGFLGSCYAREKSWKMYRSDKAEKKDE